MNVSLSIYDVFASAIPGSLYLVASVYLGVRFGWIGVADLAGLDTTVAVAGAVVASYLLGQVLGSSLRWVVERGDLWAISPIEVRETFRRRNPSVAARPFVDANPFTLLAGLRQVSPEAASEVDRARAGGIMLRSTSPAFLIGAVISFVEAIAAGRLAPVVVGVALLVLAALSLYEGQKRAMWAQMHTYECAVWMPEVDRYLSPSAEDQAGDPVGD
ncbi:MAG TPA: hypothetical protein VGJ86_18990 [Acidimicrobiales bacterium]|jgi:hypothetical protein